MSNLVIQNKFDGGQAEDPRTFATDQCIESLNFDIYTNPHQLIPIRDNIDMPVSNGAFTMDDLEITDVGYGDFGITAVGKTSIASANPSFYTASGPNGTLTLQATGTGAFAERSEVTYQGKVYAMSSNGSLQRFNSAGSVTTVGTATGQYSSFSPRPFVHPEDNVLYVVWGNVISSWNAATSTFNNYTTILPIGMECTSICACGIYLVIVMRPLNGVGNSVAYLWGRDGTLNTLQGNIDLGEGIAIIGENLQNTLVFLVSTTVVFGGTTIGKLSLKVYDGGAVNTVISIIPKVVVTSIVPYFNSTLKIKVEDRLYFTASQALALYSVYRNKEGRWVLVESNYTYDGNINIAAVPSGVQGLNYVNGYFYVGFFDNVGVYRLRVTNVSENYTSTSIYRTTINPNMPIADRYKNKQLEAVQIAYTVQSVAGSKSISMKYTADETAIETAIAETPTTPGEYVSEATMKTNGDPFKSGREFKFQLESTGGIIIKEYRYKYSVLNEQL